MEVTEQDVEYLKSKIDFSKDFKIEGYSDKFLKRRVEARIRKYNFQTIEEYTNYINNNKEEYEELLKNFAIHVTDFFRDNTFYDAFRDDIIPKIVDYKLKKGEKTIKIWSAGCSTGEEANSIAILFLDYKKTSGKDFTISITGTDVDAGTVETANKFLFDAFQVKNLPEKYKSFFHVENDMYQSNLDIRTKIMFKKHDLLKEPPLKDLDIIFCRNTVIYFNKEHKEDLYVKFYDSLKNYGFFIMGKTESMVGQAKTLFVTENMKERIFLKNV